MFDELRKSGFDVMVSNHAEAILSVDFPGETAELIAALLDFEIPAAELVGSGGGEAPSTQRLRKRLSAAGWLKHIFLVETTIDGEKKEATSHEIDHVRRGARGTIALEIEWNNKDPFFDRDLENFQRLHAQTVISAGVVVTRGASLQTKLLAIVTSFLRDNGIASEEELLRFGMKERTARQRDVVRKSVARGEAFEDAFSRQFVNDKFGMATTHWSKLSDRIARGVGNPCPLLLLGIPASAVQG